MAKGKGFSGKVCNSEAIWPFSQHTSEDKVAASVLVLTSTIGGIIVRLLVLCIKLCPNLCVIMRIRRAEYLYILCDCFHLKLGLLTSI